MARSDIPEEIRRKAAAAGAPVLRALEAKYPTPEEVQAEQAEERRRLARERRKAMRERAWRVVQALKDARLAGAVEVEIRQVGAGVQALAAWEGAIRVGRELTSREVDDVRTALRSTPLDWALRKAEDVVLRHKAAERERKKR